MSKKQIDVKSILAEALRRNDAEDRRAYLEATCGIDAELRGEIDSLLHAYENEGSILEAPSDLFEEPDVPLTEPPGTVIDKYTLLEQIGEGGMAIVYMAEQKMLIRRKVALKIIKLGMDTKSVIARFEAERQALAMMDHPNIAKVFDAGATETGRPYFVMELVKGASITEFCDINNLNTQKRMELFIQICNAVQHAHQKGIIHRDIKPSNVMVTLHDGKPVPKVIDFGIAKALNRQLTEKTLFTRYGQIIGTPAYMSPEQAEMSDLDIDIRSDVFSLGTLLYELLTGSTPFDSEYLHSKGYDEIRQIICKEEPAKPSTKISTMGIALIKVAEYRNSSPDDLRKQICADLDWIVMKTLEKDRDRRYDSVSEFAADIKRYLKNEPVLAGPPSAFYRLRKFVQRRRVLVTATMVATVGIVVGLIISTAMYLRAEKARQMEATARTDARTVIDFLKNDLLASVYPEKAKSQEVTVRYILQTASVNIENKFANSPLAQAEIHETWGLTYQKLGDYAAAEPHLERSLELRREQLGEEDPSTLTALSNLGMLYWYRGRYTEAEPLLVKVLETRRRILGEEHPDTLESMSNLSWQYTSQDRSDESMALIAKAFEIGRRVLGEEHPVVLKSMHGLATGYTITNQLDKAESLSAKGYSISRRVLGEEHEVTLNLMNMLAWVYEAQDRNDKSLELAVRALEISQRAVGEQHLATIQAMSNLGWLYMKQGRYNQADLLLTKSVELANRFLGESHMMTVFFAVRLIIFYDNTDQYEKEDVLLIKLRQMSLRVYNEKHSQSGYIMYWLISRTKQLGSLGKDQYDRDDYGNALATLSHRDEMQRLLHGESIPSDTAFIAMSLYQLDRNQEAHARLDRLRGMYEDGKHTHEERHLYQVEQLLSRDNPQVSQAWSLIESGELDKALMTLKAFDTLRDYNDPATSARMESFRKALARAYCIRGRHAQIADEYDKAINNYETAVAIHPAYVLPLHRLAWLQATCPAEEIRNSYKAIELATEACKLTKWNNTEGINVLAAAYANAGDFTAAIKWQMTAIGLLAEDGHHGVQADYAGRLCLYESGRPFRMQSQRSIVAWWKLDEIFNGKVIDSSGNGLDGQLIGDAKIAADAERGSVLSLTGDGYVDCGADIAFDITGPITVAAWTKLGAKDNQVIVVKGDTAWRLQRHQKNGVIHFGCRGLNLPNHDQTTLMGKMKLDDGTWHHIAGVFDGMKMSLYIDGDLDISAEVSGFMNINDESVTIGANPQHPGRELYGLIDDVRIYNYGLSQGEIRTLYADR